MTIALVGEYQSDEGIFPGAVGWHLDQLLSAAGISRRECLTTCVFRKEPRGGDVKNFCGPKATAAPNRPPLIRGKYLRAEFSHELDRLESELAAARPNIVVGFGSTALWALTGEHSIRATRGVTRLSSTGIKFLPTYHPSAGIRQWSLRPIIIADLEKAKRQSAFPEYIVPERRIHIPESVDEILSFEQQYFSSAPKLACDIETKQEQITCIGFSPAPNTAIVIPFFCHSGENYWQTKAEELAVWGIVRRWVSEYQTVYQNGLYDMGYLWRVYGIPAPLAADDTMLLHHALQPEMEKGLGFLASIYTDEPSWKHMGKGLKHD